MTLAVPPPLAGDRATPIFLEPDLQPGGADLDRVLAVTDQLAPTR